MSGGYCKLFTDIVTSTIWQTPNNCRVLWVTMLALKDEMNICRATVPALAKICDMPIDECQKYLNDFQSPDPYSRSQEYEGKRIEQVDGGWLILNGQKYRDMLRGQERRDYIRQKVAEHRARVNKSKHRKQSKPIAEAEAEAEAINKGGLVIPEKFSKNDEFLTKWNSWVECRKSKKRCKDFTKLFQEQLNWLDGFTVPQAIESLSQSIRGDWQGLFPPSCKNGNGHINGQLALTPIDKTILLDDRRKYEIRMTTIRNQYDGHQTWSMEDRAEYKDLKAKIAAINQKIGSV